jgi:hypothetical protein
MLCCTEPGRCALAWSVQVQLALTGRQDWLAWSRRLGDLEETLYQIDVQVLRAQRRRFLRQSQLARIHGAECGVEQ